MACIWGGLTNWQIAQRSHPHGQSRRSQAVRPDEKTARRQHRPITQSGPAEPLASTALARPRAVTGRDALPNHFIENHRRCC